MELTTVIFILTGFNCWHSFFYKLNYKVVVGFLDLHLSIYVNERCDAIMIQTIKSLFTNSWIIDLLSEVIKFLKVNTSLFHVKQLIQRH